MTPLARRAIGGLVKFQVIALFILPGLDRRFSWSPPYSWTWKASADALVAAGFLIMFLAFRANSYAAAVVEIAPDQRYASYRQQVPFRLIPGIW